MRHLWIITSVLAFVASIVWVIVSPGLEQFVVTLGSLASLTGIWATRTKRPRGIGGSAVIAGDEAKVNVANTGEIFGGIGGSGGDGGHAICVGSGTTVNIVNRGVIAGGDAGSDTKSEV